MQIDALEALREHGDRCKALISEVREQLDGPGATSATVGAFFLRIERAYASFEELHADAEATEELDADILATFDDVDAAYTDLAGGVAEALTRMREAERR